MSRSGKPQTELNEARKDEACKDRMRTVDVDAGTVYKVFWKTSSLTERDRSDCRVEFVNSQRPFMVGPCFQSLNTNGLSPNMT